MANTTKNEEQTAAEADAAQQSAAMGNLAGADPMPAEQPVLQKLSFDEEEARRLQNEADTLQAREMRLDETVEGGAYVVNGQFVDAEGKPLKSRK